MLYFIQAGDSLFSIAQRFGTTVAAIMEANVICNPNLIFIGQPLLIPRAGLELPPAGASPYYVVLPGDTLWCLARETGSSIPVLAAINQLANPNLIYPGSELLIWPEIPDAARLAETWAETGENCDLLNSLQIHGIYYLGTFQWEALGRTAIPYLLEFVNHPCNVVRYYAVLSLGRLALNGTVRAVLQGLTTDPDPTLANLVRLALRRIQLADQGNERVHLTTSPVRLHTAPNLTSPSTPYPAGTEVIALRWHIPSPTGEEGPVGDLQIYDYVQIVRTGQTGFIPRAGYRELQLV